MNEVESERRYDLPATAVEGPKCFLAEIVLGCVFPDHFPISVARRQINCRPSARQAENLYNGQYYPFLGGHVTPHCEGVKVYVGESENAF
ncbi:MAG: hypothetical protein KDA84_04425 [Planctomycetaceae bacterium]|nr:hypothetical protein [Planctomycetaceae bacterium]